MTKKVRVRLEPIGQMLEVPRGETLRDLLFGHGVEFPCGGHGRCRGCRVQVIEGSGFRIERAPGAPASHP